jgi:hypothetical protein
MISEKDIQLLKDVFATKGELESFKDEILSEIKSMREELVVVMAIANASRSTNKELKH